MVLYIWSTTNCQYIHINYLFCTHKFVLTLPMKCCQLPKWYLNFLLITANCQFIHNGTYSTSDVLSNVSTSTTYRVTSTKFTGTPNGKFIHNGTIELLHLKYFNSQYIHNGTYSTSEVLSTVSSSIMILTPPMKYCPLSVHSQWC